MPVGQLPSAQVKEARIETIFRVTRERAIELILRQGRLEAAHLRDFPIRAKHRGINRAASEGRQAADQDAHDAVADGRNLTGA